MLESLLMKKAAIKESKWTMLLSDINGYLPKRHYHSMVLLNDKIYFMGGYSLKNKARLGTVQILNLATGTYGTSSNMPEPRMSFSAVSDNVRYIYVFGGNTTAGHRANMLRFDSFTSSWTDLGTGSPPAMSNHNAVLVDRHIYILGGSADNRALWRYNIDDNSYLKKASLPVWVYDHAFCKYGDFLYAYGADPDVYRYSLATEQWELFCQGPSQVDGIRAAASFIKGTKLYLIGGVARYDWKRKIHYIDLETGDVGEVNGTWPLPNDRIHGDTVIYGDDVYLHGGGSGNPLNVDYGDLWKLNI